MAKNIKEDGNMVNSMEKLFMFWKVEKRRKDYGKMEREPNGFDIFCLLV